MFFVMIQHLTGSAWSVTRAADGEPDGGYAVAALLFIPCCWGFRALRVVSSGVPFDDPVLQVKMAFFNRNFYLARMVVTSRCGRPGRQLVEALDGPAQGDAVERSGTLALMVTVTMASVDWLMSLDPHWYSTIFGVYVFSAGRWASWAC